MTSVLMGIRKALAPFSGHFYARWIVLALPLLLAGLLVFVGTKLPPPRFDLNVKGNGIVPVGYPFWRSASDWLIGRKYAVLTFDDGPYGGDVDKRILGVLRQHHALAIFFVVCKRLDVGTDQILGEIREDGHLIGNHSYDHLRLTQLNSVDLQHQVDGCSARIAKVVGHQPRYFRPPFGQTSSEVEQVVHSAGMDQVLWNANSQDSWLVKPDKIQYFTMEEVGNGSILLMHSKPTTAEVLDRVLTDLESHGVRFVLPG